jgi:hypothetical protein
MNDPATEGSASDGGADTTPMTPEPSASTVDAAAENGLAPGAQFMREAFSLLKQHPLGAVATVAAATAFIEVELAVGILAGLGATALLANQSGPEARQRVLAGGKWALDRARTVVAKAKAPEAQVAPPV